MASKLDSLAVGGTAKYSLGQYTYTVSKVSEDEVVQTNESTNNQRDLRRILFDRQSAKRVLWEFKDDKGGWTAIHGNGLMLKLQRLPSGHSVNHKRGKWQYAITKTGDSHATQKNLSTNKLRKYRMVTKDKHKMDANWTSKGMLSLCARIRSAS